MKKKNLKKYPKSIKRQKGVVIVMALLIVALVTALAYAMMSRLERDTRRTSLILRDVQAEHYAQGSIDWAIDQLRTNVEKKNPQRLTDVVPIQSPVNEMDGFKIGSTIYDMQARFNLNNLMKPEAQAYFKRLLHVAMPSLSNDQIQAITQATVDWITPGMRQNELSSYYLQLPTPYRPAHRAMIFASEWRLVKGVSAPVFQALQPYITALPTETSINVQTAPIAVLAALSPSMSVSAARSIEAIRRSTPFISIQTFNNIDIVKNHQIDSKIITTESQYFLVETTVTIENQRLVIYTLLERKGSSGKSTVNILWQGKDI